VRRRQQRRPPGPGLTVAGLVPLGHPSTTLTLTLTLTLTPSSRALGGEAGWTARPPRNAPARNLFGTAAGRVLCSARLVLNIGLERLRSLCSRV